MQMESNTDSALCYYTLLQCLVLVIVSYLKLRVFHHVLPSIRNVSYELRWCGHSYRVITILNTKYHHKTTCSYTVHEVYI